MKELQRIINFKEFLLCSKRRVVALKSSQAIFQDHAVS